MKPFYRFAAVATTSFVLGACADADDQEVGSDTAAATTQPTAAPAPSDPEIAHIAKTANDADIEGGNLAKTKSQNADIKGFAQLMITDHTAMNEQAAQAAQRAQITPQDNSTSQQFMAEHQRASQDLKTRNGADFDRAYIAHEVQMHQKVLNDLDQTLIPNARNPDLRNELTAARAKVEAHLRRAQEIQGKL